MSVTVFQRNPQRAAALANGELIDVSEIARNDTFRLPIAVTRRLWVAVIEPQRDDSGDTSEQNASWRVRQLLRTAQNEIQKRWEEELKRIAFPVRHDGATTTVIIVATTDDDGKPTVTIGLPDEFGTPDLDTDQLGAADAST